MYVFWTYGRDGDGHDAAQGYRSDEDGHHNANRTVHTAERHTGH